MTLEFGVDFGSYTPNVTKARMECLRAKYGCEWASIGLQGNAYLDQQIEQSLAAGLKVDTYLIPRSWFGDATSQTHWQLERIKQYRGQIADCVWFDVETLYGQPDPSKATATAYTKIALKDITDAGWKAGIYTSRSMWSALIGSSAFGEYPLWEAWYGRYRPFTPFAGWQRRSGLQWQGSTLLCDLNVDLNTWETRRPDMTDEQVKALVAAVLDVRVQLNDLANATDAVIQRNDVAKQEPPLSVRGLYFVSGKAWPF